MSLRLPERVTIHPGSWILARKMPRVRHASIKSSVPMLDREATKQATCPPRTCAQVTPPSAERYTAPLPAALITVVVGLAAVRGSTISFDAAPAMMAGVPHESPCEFET